MPNASIDRDRSLRHWFFHALLFFALAATIGALLRLIYVVELPWLVFRPWLHAHSHTAMLGWVFPALLIALLGLEDRKFPRGFGLGLVLNTLLVVGMLVSFPLQGYGEFSIACSLGQMLVGYALVAQVWRATGHWPGKGSRLLVRLAFIFQVTSTMGIWAMGPIMASGSAGSEWYYWSIQWFLHFQFNGWFWFASMAIGSRWAERHGVQVRIDAWTTVLWAVGAVLTFALAVAWSERNTAVLAVNTAGVLLQFVAAWRTLMAMQRARPQAMVKTTRWMRVLIGVMLLSMAVKIAAQALVAVPMVASMALTLRNYVIGFVHLNTLGTVTVLLFAFALTRGWLKETSRTAAAGIMAFIVGYASTEALIFAQGTAFWAGWGAMPGYYWAVFLSSALMPLGAWLLVAAFLRHR